MAEFHEHIVVPGGKERDILILGVSREYLYVRNLDVLAGRFFDETDTQARNKVALLNLTLANTVFGSPGAAIGKEIKLSGLPFTVIGSFRERVDTFGQSEITDNTILIPYTVARYFTNSDEVKELFFSVSDSNEVPRATEQIKRVIESRHRPESVYKMTNLTQLLTVAGKTANTLTTVNSRIREIGVRRAVGATKAEIRAQFLTEAILISLGGGIVGIFIGLALPFSVRFITDYRIPISGWSVIIAVVVSTLVGVLFGTAPAARAAQLDPVESLRYE